MRVLISGAGIAGPTLAFWLSRYGLEPVIVERSPRLRQGGYVIDFWGLGFEIADSGANFPNPNIVTAHRSDGRGTSA